MIKITKKRFLEIFCPESTWFNSQNWLCKPNPHTDHWRRIVRRITATTVYVERVSDKKSSEFKLVCSPPNEYWYDENIGAVEIRNRNEGHDKDSLPYLILRYEPEQF